MSRVAEPYVDPRAVAGVLAGVGEGFLDDAEDGERDAGRQRPRLAVGGEGGGEAGAATVLDDAVEVVDAGLRGCCLALVALAALVVGTQHVEQMTHLVQGGAAGTLQVDERLAGRLGGTFEVGAGTSGEQLHRSQVMGDDVVQLVGDAAPFLGDGAVGEEPPVGLGVALPAVDGDGGTGHEQRGREVGDELEQGRRGQPRVDELEHRDAAGDGRRTDRGTVVAYDGEERDDGGGTVVLADGTEPVERQVHHQDAPEDAQWRAAAGQQEQGGGDRDQAAGHRHLPLVHLTGDGETDEVDSRGADGDEPVVPAPQPEPLVPAPRAGARPVRAPSHVRPPCACPRFL